MIVNPPHYKGLIRGIPQEKFKIRLRLLSYLRICLQLV